MTEVNMTEVNMTEVNYTGRKRVAVLIEKDFEDFEFKIPNTALQKAGAEIILVGSRMNEEYKSRQGKIGLKPNATATELQASELDAVLISGGWAASKIRANPNAIRLIKDAIAQGKVVAAVGYGVQVLIEAEQLAGRKVTGFHTISKDIQNAGATYINEPIAVDGSLITARRPGDLPIFTTVLLNSLNLTIDGLVLPEPSDYTYEWWQLGEAWGGWRKNDIINVLSAAITGERYTLEAFRQYSYRILDENLRFALQDISGIKQNYVARLESQLHNTFNEKVSWQVFSSEIYAIFQSWLQSNDNLSIFRRVLGDLQTGVVDIYNLYNDLTDPATVAILEEIQHDLAQQERRLIDIGLAHFGTNLQSPTPSTIAAFK